MVLAVLLTLYSVHLGNKCVPLWYWARTKGSREAAVNVLTTTSIKRPLSPFDHRKFYQYYPSWATLLSSLEDRLIFMMMGNLRNCQFVGDIKTISSCTSTALTCSANPATGWNVKPKTSDDATLLYTFWSSLFARPQLVIKAPSTIEESLRRQQQHQEEEAPGRASQASTSGTEVPMVRLPAPPPHLATTLLIMPTSDCDYKVSWCNWRSRRTDWKSQLIGLSC